MNGKMYDAIVQAAYEAAVEFRAHGDDGKPTHWPDYPSDAWMYDTYAKTELPDEGQYLFEQALQFHFSWMKRKPQ